MSASPHPTLEIPVLETDRLLLRGHRLDDFPASAAMWADSNVTRHIMGKPCSEEESWSRLLRYIGHWKLAGFGYWVVEEKATGHFVGEVGFADYKRDIEPSIHGMPELGWVLTSAMHGKGYATEAAGAALAWGDKHFGSSKTVCLIAPENVASLRVAEKCGYREFWRTTYKSGPTILLMR
jgi:RimJ/RimL family protein N-acetyltransferase